MGKHDDDIEPGLMEPRGVIGLTLRDYFAAHTLTGILPDDFEPAHIARLAYGLADAMIAERAQPVARTINNQRLYDAVVVALSEHADSPAVAALVTEIDRAFGFQSRGRAPQRKGKP